MINCLNRGCDRDEDDERQHVDYAMQNENDVVCELFSRDDPNLDKTNDIACRSDKLLYAQEM